MSDPQRWTSQESELSASYDEAVAAFRAEGPSEAQLARMLSVVGGAGAGATAYAALAWKATLGALGVATLLAGALWFKPSPSQQPARPRPSVERAPAPLVVVSPEARAVPSAPAPDLAPQEAPTARAQKGASVKRTAASAPDLVTELQLLQRARRTLTTDPARTLALTDEHLRMHPTGSFAEEREALAIEALIGLARRAAAKRRLTAFQAQFGRSIHRTRLETLLAE